MVLTNHNLQKQTQCTKLLWKMGAQNPVRPNRRLCIHTHIVVEVVGNGVELAEAEAAA